MSPAATTSAALTCHYFESGLCRSCSLLPQPVERQLAEKEADCRELLAEWVPTSAWLPAVSGGVREFRNRAKLAVGGRKGSVTLGILDAEKHGVDLTDCPVQEAAIRRVLPRLADFVNELAIAPYNVRARVGELKYVHVTANPAGELLLRFVVRSGRGRELVTRGLARLRRAVPEARVITVNLLPEHRAVLEGDREVVLHGEWLPMPIGGGVSVQLLPQSFFQTNTRVAGELYSQVTAWLRERSPESVLDLYCGVGGFGLRAAAALGEGSRVTGVEISEQAVQAASRSAAQLGLSGASFVAEDATAYALSLSAAKLPAAVVVNPPRRGLSEQLTRWLRQVPLVVYSSCNPVTLARDLAQLPTHRVRAARLFDMFPHTPHAEVAVLLTQEE